MDKNKSNVIYKLKKFGNKLNVQKQSQQMVYALNELMLSLKNDSL